jgi:glycosyltransferase involved in cell wall biosynthesis
VVVFNKGGREERLARLAQGEEVPREFFYGFFALEDAGISAATMSSAVRHQGFTGEVADVIERTFAWITALGVRPLSARLLADRVRGAKVLISHTDGFSLSMGLGLGRSRRRPVLIGGFQGLSDIGGRTPAPLQAAVHRVIRAALSGLDHIFFLSAADRDAAVAAYRLPLEKVSLFTFGVDTAFWRPCPDIRQEDFAFAIGQDSNRDFATLVRAPGQYPTRIVTSLPLDLPPDRDHVQVLRGGFSAGPITDTRLRELYSAARVVVVPSKDVLQPTGQSVTLQAMSCGRPVILSKIRGLWSNLLEDGENCLLVPPGDAPALGAAIGRIKGDRALAARLGNSARRTALAHFGLDALGKSAVSLARRGLEIWRQRHWTAGS